MKHHIDNKELKDFKKKLFEIKDDRNKRERKPINIKFIINGEIVYDDKFTLINYGCVQTDKYGHIISSDDSSYNFKYRKDAQKDKIKYYILSMDFKGLPQIKIYITSKSLTFTDKENEFILSWKSLSGESKTLIVTKLVE